MEVTMRFIAFALLFPLLALAQSPKVCFSPDEHCDVPLVDFVSGAATSLDIAIYDINRPALVEQIIAKSKVMPVRVVVDRRQSLGASSKVSELLKAKVAVRYGHQAGIMHDKFTIRDGAELETGSFNYTNHASIANQENQIYLTDPEVLERYKTRFEKMWASATEPGKKPARAKKSR
jgi:phosphatidylserine/phosphatidylglycerophosphate/cardiolipin synthase-like enzyme